MALARDVSTQSPQASHRRCSLVRQALIREGLFDTGSASGSGLSQWRISPEPFFLTSEDRQFLDALGRRLLAFYRALNRLYLESVRGTQPAWVSAYLDQGKPDTLVGYGRMKRLREHLPAVIRPDLIPTDQGMVMTELDSVPGGIGLTGCLSRAYAELEDHNSPYALIGGDDGMVRGFAHMLQSLARRSGIADGVCAIVVSEESKDYRPEMQWLASRIRALGLETYCLEPREVRFTEEALYCQSARGERRIAVLYRFFELFDLKNVPKAELILYGAKKERVVVTPPIKPQLEEKLAFALLHHPVLTAFWRRELGEDDWMVLTGMTPRTWVLDPRPIPPMAVIPGLVLERRPVTNWAELAVAGQKDRRYVLKPSGFSPLAWGSRGVAIGHDLPQADWAQALQQGLTAFSSTPYILQEFHKGRQVHTTYLDPGTGELVPMAGRARLCPYYFVQGDQIELGGVLATICSVDKKIIHGMRDAVLAPCAVPLPPPTTS